METSTSGHDRYLNIWNLVTDHAVFLLYVIFWKVVLMMMMIRSNDWSLPTVPDEWVPAALLCFKNRVHLLMWWGIHPSPPTGNIIVWSNSFISENTPMGVTPSTPTAGFVISGVGNGLWYGKSKLCCRSGKYLSYMHQKMCALRKSAADAVGFIS